MYSQKVMLKSCLGCRFSKLCKSISAKPGATGKMVGKGMDPVLGEMVYIEWDDNPLVCGQKNGYYFRCQFEIINSKETGLFEVVNV